MTAAHEKGFFTEEDSVEVVTGRNASAHDERLEFAMEVITRKLHEAVRRSSRLRENGSRRSRS